VNRKMIWRDETAFSGWVCSNCGWLFPNPAPIGVDMPPMDESQAKEIYESKAMEEFSRHDCAKHPLRSS
jgi:hypothetical protein